MPEKKEIVESPQGDVHGNRGMSIPDDQVWLQVVLSEQTRMLKEIKKSILGIQISIVMVYFFMAMFIFVFLMD